MQLTIKDIFDKVSEKEGHKFEVNVPYLPKNKFKIETKNGFEEVGSMIIKDDVGFNLFTDIGEVKVSAKHQIMTDDGLKFVRDLKIGDVLENVNSNIKINDIEVKNLVQVYDISIGTKDHLYIDAAGFVHHNTFHITEGPRSLPAILGPEGKDWTYHSGTKAAPFSFFKTLFQERDKIIVFDEADSLLKNPDIVMMLKPILDTSSGANMAEYMSGTKNMVGKSLQEIEEYSSYIQQELENGAIIGHKEKDGVVVLPSKFNFTGGMIFISNMRANKIEEAIMSRSIFIDVYLAQQDVVKRIRSIAHAQAKSLNISIEEADEIVDALSSGTTAKGENLKINYMTPEYARESKNLTARAFKLAVILKKSGLPRWAELSQMYA